MKKYYGFVILIILIFSINVNCSVSYAEYSETNQITNFRIENIIPGNSDKLDYINWWYSNQDNCYCVFLPAAADRKSLTIIYDTENNVPVFFNDIRVNSGEKTDILSKGDEFDITINGELIGKLKVMQSEIASIFISSDDGGLDAFLKNKNIVQTGRVLMIDSNGNIEYSGSIDKITAHGNSSWGYSDKKSYNIRLPEKSNLYGMGKAKKWMLISNCLDQTLLRNSIGIELSRNAGVDPALEYIYADLYSAGEYKGTYQLLERVEIQKNRINITDLEKKTEKINDKDLNLYERKVKIASSPSEYLEGSCKYYDIPNNPKDITGGYLLEFQMWNRYGYKAPSGFVTEKGQAIDLKSPEYISEAQMSYIQTFVQDFEDAIYSDTGYNDKGKHYSEYIDVDSLVRAYLVQEITMNIDATFASFFLWKDSDLTGDGKIHFGPSWDFDLSINNLYTYYNNGEGIISYSSKPNNIFVANFPVNGFKLHQFDTGSGRNTYGLSWISQLYRRKEFYKKVCEIYFSEFNDYLCSLCNKKSNGRTGIEEMADTIRKSAEMNSIRWHTFDTHPLGKSNGDTFDVCIGYISDFLSKRQKYLSELWYPTIKSGDVNDDNSTDILDIIMLKKYILIDTDYTAINLNNSDINADGNINIIDFNLLISQVLFYHKT